MRHVSFKELRIELVQLELLSVHPMHSTSVFSFYHHRYAATTTGIRPMTELTNMTLPLGYSSGYTSIERQRPESYILVQYNTWHTEKLMQLEYQMCTTAKLFTLATFFLLQSWC